MDIELILRVDDTKLNDLKLGIAKYFNIDSTEVNATWFKAFLQDMLFKFYKTGKIWIARDTTAPVIDENIIEVL